MSGVSQKQKKWKWIEPDDVYGGILIHIATEEQIIKHMRERLKMQGTDDELLDEFVVVHWAVPVKGDETL